MIPIDLENKFLESLKKMRKAVGIMLEPLCMLCVLIWTSLRRMAALRAVTTVSTQQLRVAAAPTSDLGLTLDTRGGHIDTDCESC